MRNAWFGTDVEMTESAYAIHDELMAENVNPSSDYYYQQIEDRVRQQFPARFLEFSTTGACSYCVESALSVQASNELKALFSYKTLDVCHGVRVTKHSDFASIKGV